MKSKVWIYGLVVAGVLLIALPPANQWYQDWKQERVLADIEAELMAIEARREMLQEFAALSQLLDRGEDDADLAVDDQAAAESPETVPLEPIQETQQEPENVPLTEAEQAHQKAIAVIEIEKINLKLPVLEGATQENMKYSATRMTQTTPIGEIGNAAISAHRSRKTGRLFNRLDELKEGDRITITTRDQTFVYTVFDTSIVEPEDITVLASNDEDRLLTLITCDPVVDPTHRLIVHARIEATPSSEA